ncbi:MAG: hypothetical protein IKP37_02570 [Paludibacteraceae bacterium]|nr:hypothetical protein [Paludibacteraceae bacterium]
MDTYTYTLVKSFKNGRADYWYTIAKSEGEALRYFEKKFSRRWLCGCALYLGDALFEGAVFINNI